MGSKGPDVVTELIIPKHETCGTCEWGDIVPEDMKLRMCTAMPPVPVVLGARQTVAGPQPYIESMRPGVPASLKACSLHKRKAGPLN